MNNGLDLLSRTLGSLQTNCYVLVLPNNRCLVFDPGAEPDTVREMIGERDVAAILLTHAHADHIGAVNDIKRDTGAPVYLHTADVSRATGTTVDHRLQGDETLEFDGVTIRVVHTPGHTDGMVSFLLPDNRAIVGDTIFEGGPGKTWSNADFRTTLQTLLLVMQWPDDTICYPGHGPSFRLGDIRPRVQEFFDREHPDDFHGDAEW